MAKERSEKSRCKSTYGSNYVSDAQYITEQLCVHIARASKKELPDQFWMQPEWQKLFKGQIPAAVKLLKKYSLKAIMLALRDKRAYRVRSLRAPFFEDFVKEYQAKLDSQPVTTTEASEVVEPPRQPQGEQSLRSKLGEIS